jgi:hypothetical protein
VYSSISKKTASLCDKDSERLAQRIRICIFSLWRFDEVEGGGTENTCLVQLDASQHSQPLCTPSSERPLRLFHRRESRTRFSERGTSPSDAWLTGLFGTDP